MGQLEQQGQLGQLELVEKWHRGPKVRPIAFGAWKEQLVQLEQLVLGQRLA